MARANGSGSSTSGSTLPKIVLVGPERDDEPGRGSFAAVWVDLDRVDAIDALPSAVAGLIAVNHGVWPAVVEIAERPR